MVMVLLANAAHAAPALTLFGAPKYRTGFHHFDYVNPNAPKGGTLKLSTSAPFDNVNPYLLKGIAAPGINGFVYQTLMTPSYDEPQSYYPLIADTVTVAKDKSYVEFTLNPRARWHDGTPITPADVVFSFDILKARGHPSFRMMYAAVRATKIGPRGVRFTFRDKTQRELPVLVAGMPVLPKHGFCEGVVEVPPPGGGRLGGGRSRQEPTNNLQTRSAPTPPLPLKGREHCTQFDKTTLTPPLGSGPYRVAGIDAGRSITFARVPDYWGANVPSQRGLYNFDTIRYDVYRDDTVALEGIKSHQFDFYEEFIARNWATSYDIPAVHEGRLIKTLIPHEIPRGMQGFMFNTRLPKFADARVREAIGLTLDFDWMNEKLFYGAYVRNGSYFNHTEFDSRFGEEGVERESSLNPDPERSGERRSQSRILNPTSGYPRAALIRAQQLLNEAGWVMRDGHRVNAETGAPLTVEFMMTQRTFERVIAVMRVNLRKLGIDADFRYVDASQYQKRVDQRQFDVVSVWWNQGLFYPGAEQFAYWHSSEATVEGSQNLGGIQNPVVDRLVEQIRSAQTLEQLRPAAQALDRVLLREHYITPHWNINAWRVVYWDQFGRPDITPKYNLGIESWWVKPGFRVDESSPNPDPERSGERRSQSQPLNPTAGVTP